MKSSFTIYDHARNLAKRLHEKVSSGEYDEKELRRQRKQRGKDLVEEAAELMGEAIGGDRKDMIAEAEDVLHKYLDLLALLKISLRQVEAGLKHRPEKKKKAPRKRKKASKHKAGSP